jgi:hypothetical protein
MFSRTKAGSIHLSPWPDIRGIMSSKIATFRPRIYIGKKITLWDDGISRGTEKYALTGVTADVSTMGTGGGFRKAPMITITGPGWAWSLMIENGLAQQANSAVNG